MNPLPGYREVDLSPKRDRPIPPGKELDLIEELEMMLSEPGRVGFLSGGVAPNGPLGRRDYPAMIQCIESGKGKPRL
jgi:hypothetical protein